MTSALNKADIAVFLQRVGELLDTQVSSWNQLSGGDFAASFRIELDNGGVVFAKTHPHASPQFFETEAAGLQWLAEAAEELVPHVLGVHSDPPLLILEWIEVGLHRHATDERFGQQLATLHQHDARVFGREDARPTGSRGLPNDPCDTWVEFMRDRRLIPLADDAAHNRALPHALILKIRKVAEQLESMEVPVEQPARLHGDLWAGNRLVDTNGNNWIIDPAAHGGHREFDLGMMKLFGGFGPQCFAAYNETFPLSEGWEQRIALFQLPPLIVHAIKFGGAYVDATNDALESVLQRVLQ